MREDLVRAICRPGIVSLIKRISRRRETMATTRTIGSWRRAEANAVRDVSHKAAETFDRVDGRSRR